MDDETRRLMIAMGALAARRRGFTGERMEDWSRRSGGLDPVDILGGDDLSIARLRMTPLPPARQIAALAQEVGVDAVALAHVLAENDAAGD